MYKLLSISAILTLVACGTEEGVAFEVGNATLDYESVLDDTPQEYELCYPEIDDCTPVECYTINATEMSCVRTAKPSMDDFPGVDRQTRVAEPVVEQIDLPGKLVELACRICASSQGTNTRVCDICDWTDEPELGLPVEQR